MKIAHWSAVAGNSDFGLGQSIYAVRKDQLRDGSPHVINEVDMGVCIKQKLLDALKTETCIIL
jgi:hypothetical protein